MLLAIASVEALTPEESWTDTQKQMLQSFASAARSFPGATEHEIEEIVTRLTTQPKLSVNQGLRRLFDRLGVIHLWPRWGAVYNVRSRILHGDVRPEEVQATIDEAMHLSRVIVLTAAAREIADANIILGDRAASEGA